jgi:O-antigen ligase
MSRLPVESFTAFIQIVFIFLIAYPVVRIALQEENDVLTTIHMLIIPGLLITAGMLLFYFTNTESDLDIFSLIEIGWGGRLSYGEMEPNIPARILLQILPLCMVISCRSRLVWKKILFIIFIASIILAVFLTASRSSLLTLLVGVFFYSIFYIKMRKRVNIYFILLYIVIQYSLFQFVNYIDNSFYNKPLDRYSTILDPKSSDSSIERLDIIDKGFEFINKNPLFGLGLENSSLYTGISVHNPIILTWVENGVFGMIGFGSIYFILLFIGLKCYRNNFFNDDLLMAFTLVMVMMVFGDMFMANSYKRILWLPALMMIVNYDRVRDRVR